MRTPEFEVKQITVGQLVDLMAETLGGSAGDGECPLLSVRAEIFIEMDNQFDMNQIFFVKMFLSSLRRKT